MIPFLPDLPATPGPGPLALPQPGVPTGTGAPRPALDFAGLLDAAMPGVEELSPEAAAPDAGAIALPADPDAPPVPPLRPGLRGLSEQAPAPAPGKPSQALQSGTILPPTGESLPPVDPGPVAATPVPQGIPAPAEAEPAPAKEEAPDTEAADLAAILPGLLPVALQAGAPAPIAARPPLRTVAGEPDHRVLTAQRPLAPMQAAVQRDAAPAPMPDMPMPPLAGDTPAAPTALAMPDNPSQTAATLASAQPPAALLPAAQPQAAIPSPAPGDHAAPREGTAQIESAIAQVGEIREALRAARPELTMRHAEFGFVSLRLEATGAAQDWRAVLASRDPGFVPAVQAALAERMVAASSGDTATTGNGAGQSSASGDQQRYGSSPNGGQGSSQPYLAHSGQRDEGAAQHQRQAQQQTTDRAAAAAATDEDAPAARKRGLFA